MARQRTRIAEGIYRDAYGLAATVKVGTTQREQRFAADEDLDHIQAWRAYTRGQLLDERQDRKDEPPELARGTLEADAPIFLKTIEHRESYRADRCHLKAWLPHLGKLRRRAIRPAQVQRLVTAWSAAGVAAYTIRHRCRVLRALYRTLDKQHARPPLAGVIIPKPPIPHPVPVPWGKVQATVKSLKYGKKQKGTGFGGISRFGYVRLLVLATTGQRPAQLMRAEPGDVDLTRGIWFVRAAKDGQQVPLPLDAAMVKAWRAFIAADAWGEFNTTSFAQLLRRNGWPAGVRPYALRHTMAIDLILGGADLGDVQGALGHRQIETTRKFYGPVLLARARRSLKLLRRGALK